MLTHQHTPTHTYVPALEYQRTADDAIYLTENRYQNVKEHFKQVASLLRLDTVSQAGRRLLDIGGATGEFLHYVRSLQPDLHLHCVEYSSQLVVAARERLSSHRIEIEQGDANKLDSIPSESFDFVTTLGVTSIFDDFKPSFSEMIRVGKDHAVCLNSMLVNEYPVDVIIKYLNPATGQPESGWNKFSLASIEQYLMNHENVSGYRFEKHVMPFDLPQRKDVMRSWTTFNNKGERILWNGLGMEISIYHILFTIKK